MGKYDDQPVYRVNKWITEELRSAGIIPAVSEYITDLDTEENFALPFMSAAQQTPESTTPYNSGAYHSLPFCVWTVEQKGGHDQPWSRCGGITYVFYANDVNKVLAIANFVHDLTNREDWSATDINYFYRNDETYPFDFKYICFDTGTGPAPATDEGGRNAYMVIIEYQATYEGTNRNGDYGAVTGLGRI
jgi:hypothetical protein